MHQFEQSQAHDEEKQAFQDFQACNQHHAGVVLLRHYAFVVARLLEHSLWASYRFVEETGSTRCEKAMELRGRATFSEVERGGGGPGRGPSRGVCLHAAQENSNVLLLCLSTSTETGDNPVCF